MRCRRNGGRLLKQCPVGGEDIDPAQLVVWDRRARQLATGNYTAHTEPQQSSSQYTPEFLSRVAAAHAGGSYAAVQEEFDVSRRQAARYISRARQSGLVAK